MDARSQRLWQRGMSHLSVGNHEAAQATLEAMLAIDPGSAPALFGLSVVHARRGRFLAATDFALRAQELEPRRVELLSHLARCHLMCGRPEAARAVATRALALPRENALLLDALGVLMTRLDEQTLAIELFDQAIALQPGLASLHFSRAHAHKMFGQTDAAEADLEACLALDPAHADAHWALAELRPRGPDDNHVPRLRAQLSQAPAGSAQEEMLALALFRELDELDRPGEAWLALERGIASRRGRWLAGGQQPRNIGDALLRACGEESQVAPATRTPAAPLFVLGMPGAGVALLGRILSRHSKVHHLGEQAPFSRLLAQAIGRDSIAAFDAEAIERFGAVDFEALGAEYLAAVTPPGTRGLVLCESPPMNFQLAPFIARALPNARFLHVTREPVDNCVSILAHPGGETSLPAIDADSVVSAFHEYRRLMLHWDRLLPGRMMEVGYESLVERPETVLRVACSFTGLRYGSSLRTGLKLHARSIGRGARYLARLPALQALC